MDGLGTSKTGSSSPFFSNQASSSSMIWLDA